MRVAVTGARGFVGPHLVAHLEACGDDVLSLDRRGPDSFDVTDPTAVRERLADTRPEVVYHLAALSHVGESWKSPATSFRVNAEGTLNVLHACTELGLSRVVVVLSSEEYGRVDEADLPLTEESSLRPVEVPRLVGSNARLRAATGWTPTIPLPQTLADVLQSARDAL